MQNDRISLRLALSDNKHWCPMQRSGADKRRWRRIRRINRLRRLSDDWVNDEIPNSSTSDELLTEYKER